MFSMPVKVNFDGGECCWEEEEEEEEEELCCPAGGGKAGSPFKEGSFVGFLSWVSTSRFFFFLFLFSILFSWCFAMGFRLMIARLGRSRFQDKVEPDEDEGLVKQERENLAVERKL